TRAAQAIAPLAVLEPVAATSFRDVLEAAIHRMDAAAPRFASPSDEFPGLDAWRWESAQAGAKRSDPFPGAARSAPSCFDLLGISWPCGHDALRRAFRARALQLHPARPTGSEAAFVALMSAYTAALAIVGDPSNAR